MIKKIISALISSSIIFSCLTSVFADSKISDVLNNDIYISPDICNHEYQYSPYDTVTFIVEVDGEPLTACENALHQQNEHYFSDNESFSQEQKLLSTQNKVINTIKTKVNRKIEKEFTYTALFNGFSLTTEYKNMEKIKNIPGVVNVYVSDSHFPTKPYMTYASEQTNVKPYVYDTLGFSGEGQAIAILDSEFDTSHEYFNTAPKTPKYTKKDIEDIIGSNSLNITTALNQVYKSEKIPFAYDYGCMDGETFDNTPEIIHGTHVAGIAGGKNALMSDGTTPISGVAPEAQLILMKITNSNGSFSDAVIFAALDDAVKFGVSAVNLSFGIDYASTALYPKYEQLLDNARKAGVFISISSANASRGYHAKLPTTENIDYSSSGVPASFTSGTSVASANNIYKYAYTGELTTGDSSKIKYMLPFESSSFATAFANDYFQYEYCGYGTDEEIKNLDLTGKIALIKRGNISLADKAANAKNAGANGIIIWNNKEGYFNSIELSLPAAVVSSSAGQILHNASLKTLTVSTLKYAGVPFDNGMQISIFSSWGTSDTLELKPEITAPGGYIYSSVPNNKYDYMSGTSMAAPQITGIAALMNQYYCTNPFSEEFNSLQGDEKVTLFENLLMSTADVIIDNNIPISPRNQGAGMVNAKNAMTTPVILSGTEGKAKISLKDGLSDTFSFNITLQNLSDKDVTFNNLSLEVTTDGSAEYDGKTYVSGTARISAKSDLPKNVTVHANEKLTLPVTVTLDSDFTLKNLKTFKNGFYIDGFVYFRTSDANACNLNIPFTGFYGNWKDAPVFDTTMYDDGLSSLYRENDRNSPGTYLSTNFNNNYVMLGKNLFSKNTNREHIAISPDGDGLFDDLILNLQPLRTADTSLAISDSNGNTILKISNSFLLNKFYSSSIKLSSLSNLDDGKYTINAYGFYKYGEKSPNADDVLSLPFVIDRKPPELTQVDLNRADNILRISAKDNNYLQGIAIYYTDSNGESAGQVIPVAHTSLSEIGDTASAEFNISGINPDNIQIEVYDCAMNVSIGSLNYFMYDLYAELSDAYRDSEITILKYKIINRSDNAIKAKPIIALYDENNRLTNVSLENSVTIAPGASEHTFYINCDTSSVSSTKFMLWDSVENMKPLSAPSID